MNHSIRVASMGGVLLASGLVILLFGEATPYTVIDDENGLRLQGSFFSWVSASPNSSPLSILEIIAIVSGFVSPVVLVVTLSVLSAVGLFIWFWKGNVSDRKGVIIVVAMCMYSCLPLLAILVAVVAMLSFIKMQ